LAVNKTIGSRERKCDVLISAVKLLEGSGRKIGRSYCSWSSMKLVSWRLLESGRNQDSLRTETQKDLKDISVLLPVKI